MVVVEDLRGLETEKTRVEKLKNQVFGLYFCGAYLIELLKGMRAMVEIAERGSEVLHIAYSIAVI